MDMGKKWRERRNHLWKDQKCNKNKSCKRNCARKPEEISSKSDWEQFVKYKLGAKPKARSETNKANRAKQTVYHVSGSKPFNRKQKEMEEREGRKIGRAELFMETHMREDLSFPSEGTEDLAEQVIHNMADPTVDEGTSPNDVVGRCFKGKEKPGRVRFMGHGKNPKQVFKFGSSSSSAPPLPYADPNFIKKFGLAMIDHLQRAQVQGGLSAELLEMAQVFSMTNPGTSSFDTQNDGSNNPLATGHDEEDSQDMNED